MATYDSIHTGEQVDNAVDIVLGNKGKGSATQPIYLDANGVAQNVNVDATPTDSSANLVRSGGVFTQLSTKYAKADISTDPNLGTSNTVIPSQGAVKSYVDTKLATKQDVVVAGDGIVKTGNTLSISTDNDFMTAGKLDNKWSHFVSGLDMGYGTETIEKIENAKRSSFDRSKFTVVGSPVITDDGVASGFSTSSYIRTVFTLAQLAGKSWTIKGSFYFDINNIPSYSYNINDIVNLSDSYQNYGYIGMYRFSSTSAKPRMQITTGTTGDTYIGYVESNNVLTSSEWLSFEASFDINVGRYYFKVYGEDGRLIVDDYLSPNSTSKELLRINTSPTDNIRFGRSLDTIIGYDKIDLKQFSITVDGVEVFSGNKTGIDIIKPDDYTVVGTPTISADGVASGFSGSNYLKTTVLDITKPFEIDCKLIEGNGFAGGQPDSFLFGKIDNALRFWVYTSGGLTTITTTNTYNTVYAKFYFDGVKYGIKSSLDGKNYTVENEQVIENVVKNSTICEVGRWSTNYFSGSIDLNSIKIYVDGDLVYQPCLKIPYTQTKDGKKIVDYNYKSRVEDEYGQAGFTPYYTLDTESRGNYTVVGSPTISSDFVASGFSSLTSAPKYLSIPVIQLGQANTWKVIHKFTTGSSVAGYQWIFSSSYDTFYGGYSICITNASNLSTRLGSTSTTAADIANLTSLSALPNTTYTISTEFTGTQYIINYKIGNGSWTNYGTINSTTKLYNNLDGFYIGRRSIGNTEEGFTGSIDLKEFKIYVDNKLAYEAVIPPNYTMATVKESTIVDSYDNGINKWTKLANLTCKQQGSCTSGTAVTFTKPYIDTNYALSVPYASGTKTKTGFTPSATGDWIANGKVNLNA